MKQPSFGKNDHNVIRCLGISEYLLCSFLSILYYKNNYHIILIITRKNAMDNF